MASTISLGKSENGMVVYLVSELKVVVTVRIISQVLSPAMMSDSVLL